jgi:hypothetical protein
MIEAIVTSPRFVAALEIGIGTVGDFGNIEQSLRLRHPDCNPLASVAIQHYLTQKGYSAELAIGPSREPDLTHVVVRTETPDGTELTIDPENSRYLGYVGLTTEYIRKNGNGNFPTGKIACYEPSDGYALALELASEASHFQRRIGLGSLSAVSVSLMISRFSGLLNPNDFSPFQPNDSLDSAGRRLAELLINNDTLVVDKRSMGPRNLDSHRLIFVGKRNPQYFK